MSESQSIPDVSNLGKDIRISYVKGKPGYIVPARDYSYYITRLSGGIVDINDFQVVVFLHIGLLSPIMHNNFISS